MKKGAVVGIISVLGFVAALILYLSFVGEEGPQKYENYLGESQMKVMEAMYKAERAMLYADSSGKLSAYKSLIELGKSGGYHEDVECEIYKDYVVWNDCFPERGKNVLTNSFLDNFERYFKEYLNVYPEILISSEYDCSLINKEGEYIPIECNGKEEIKIPVVLELEGKKERSAKKAGIGGVSCGVWGDVIHPLGENGDKVVRISEFKNSRHGGSREHRGVDYYPGGTRPPNLKKWPVYAIKDGEIWFKPFASNSYGYWVEINHGGSYKSRYAHLNSYVGGSGEKRSVSKGDLIGYTGVSGTSRTDEHLHFEMMDPNGVTVKGYGTRLLNPELCFSGSGERMEELIEYNDDFEEERDSFVTVKTKLQLGTYKIKHNFKEEIDYNFEDYDKIIETVRKCMNIDVEAVRNCVGSEFGWDIEEEGEYLLFDVKTDKKFPVETQFENVVIRFAMKK